MKTLIIYNPQLTGTGGVVTFTINICKRLSKHYKVTLYYKKATNENLLKIGEYVDVKPYKTVLNADCVILASNSNTANIKAEKVIQVLHADYKEQKKQFNITYKKNPNTTHHVSVSNHVKEVFESMYPYKVDKVIYNLL